MDRAWRESQDRLLFDSKSRSTVPLWAGGRPHARRHDAQQPEENDDNAAAIETLSGQQRAASHTGACSGTHGDRRLKRLRTRGDQRRVAAEE